MTLEDGTELSPALGHRRLRRQDARGRRAVHQGEPGGRPAGRRPARLRGDGRLRRRRPHRRDRRRRDHRRLRLRRRRHGRPRRPPACTTPARSSPSTSIPPSSSWPAEFGATHTVNASAVDPVEAIRDLTDGFGADVCVEAVGNPAVLEQAFFARDLAGRVVQVGVPDAGHAHARHPDDRVLRPGWRAQTVVVRGLPPVARLPGAGRAVPAGPLPARPSSCPSASGWTRSRRRSTGWSGARCSAAWWSCEQRPPCRSRRHVRDLLDRRRGLRGRQQHLARRRRRRGRSSSTPPTTPAPIVERGRRPAGDGDRVHPRPQRPHQRRRRPRRRHRCPDPAPRRRPHAVGRRVPRPSNPTGPLADGDTITVAGTDLHGAAHAGPLPRRHLSATMRPPARLFGGDTLVQRRPGRHRPLVLRASTPSSTRSATDCWRSRRRPWSTPATATPRPSATRPRTSTSGSPAATDDRAPGTCRSGAPMGPGSCSGAGDRVRTGDLNLGKVAL